MEDQEQQDLFVGRIAQKIYYRNYNLVYLIYGPLIREPAFLKEKMNVGSLFVVWILEIKSRPYYHIDLSILS